MIISIVVICLTVGYCVELYFNHRERIEEMKNSREFFKDRDEEI